MSPTPAIPVPSAFFDLPGDGVHVLCLDTSAHKEWLETTVSALDPDEQQRAARYLDPWHGRRFAYTRGLLRTLLGRFSRQTASGITFSYGPYGKPEMTDADGLHFNLAHSGDWTALGLSRGRRIGLDLECVAGCRDCLAVARQSFTPRELAMLARERNTAGAFCTLWARKEAVLKAAGLGLDSLRAFCTADPAIELHDADGVQVQWSVSEIESPAGYAMALAAEGGPVRHASFRL